MQYLKPNQNLRLLVVLASLLPVVWLSSFQPQPPLNRVTNVITCLAAVSKLTDALIDSKQGNGASRDSSP
jgi:hypothetical protein